MKDKKLQIRLNVVITQLIYDNRPEMAEVIKDAIKEIEKNEMDFGNESNKENEQGLEIVEKSSVNLTRSETWMENNFNKIDFILKETIKEFIDEDEQIINIQMIKDETGLSRFWIYSM